MRLFCSKCKKSFNVAEVYCTECYYTLINKVRKLEEEKEDMLLEIQNLKGCGEDWI